MSEPPPSPSRPRSPPPAERGKLRKAGPRRLLRALRGIGGSDGTYRQLPSPLRPPCYAKLGVRPAAKLRCLAYRAIVTIDEADREALRQRGERFRLEGVAAAR